MESTTKIQKQPQLQIDSLFEAFEDIVNITEEQFNSFGYVKSPEYLRQEALAKEESGDGTEVSSVVFDDWKCKYWDKLEAYEDNLIENINQQMLELQQGIKDE